MFAPITKVNEGESNTPCPSTLEVTYSWTALRTPDGDRTYVRTSEGCDIEAACCLDVNWW
jgi:hypothetical protein